MKFEIGDASVPEGIMTTFDIGDVVDVKWADKPHRGIVTGAIPGRKRHVGDFQIMFKDSDPNDPDVAYEHECTPVSDEELFGVPRAGTWWDRKGLTYKTSPVQIIEFKDGLVRYRKASIHAANSLAVFLERFEPAKFKT